MKWQWSQNFLHLLHTIDLIFIILVAWLIFFWFMLKNWHFCCEVVSTKVLHTPYILLKKPLKYDMTKWRYRWQTCSSLEQQQVLHLRWYTLKLVTHAKTIWSTHQKKTEYDQIVHVLRCLHQKLTRGITNVVKIPSSMVLTIYFDSKCATMKSRTKGCITLYGLAIYIKKYLS